MSKSSVIGGAFHKYVRLIRFCKIDISKRTNLIIQAALNSSINVYTLKMHAIWIWIEGSGLDPHGSSGTGGGCVASGYLSCYHIQMHGSLTNSNPK